ncbi:SHOCT domain-containing protein [Haloferax namakaokahaiae]|uniref:SHOCT domain-containing protein n=1 Tax=Haloferax namakaokahaiae TaxID=1748331 RepID=A0ABD5ZHQ3_9EURY
MTGDSRGVLLSKATDITALLITGIWLSALLLGFDWWLVFMLIGYIVILPIVDMLTDGYSSSMPEEFERTWEETFNPKKSADSTGTDDETPSNRDALNTLRDRYARGELTDEQFERKLERLLETESLEDIEDRVSERERA